MFVERRKYRRVQANIDVQVELIFPEETFQPQKRGGQTLNISGRGMKIRMFDVPQSLYKKMLSPMRYAKIAFVLPTTNKQKVLHAKIVWLDYSSLKRECTLGIYFDILTPEDQQEMYDFIEMLERQK